LASDSDHLAPLRFGYVVVSTDPRDAVQQGILAEKSKFDIVWIPDHFTDVDGDRLEPWTILSAIATQTRKIRLGSAVTDTQRSHPARTAHSVASVDTISRGRAILGIGAGEAMNIVPFGLPWDTASCRISRLEEAIQVIQLLWSSSREEPANFSGKHFKLLNAFLTQSSVQKPHPPIYVGAFSSKKALQVVGRRGDGWYAWLNTPELFKERWAIICDAAKSIGRSPKLIEPTSHLMMALPRNSTERKEAVMAAKTVLLLEKSTLARFGYHSEIKQYQNLGVLPQDIAWIRRTAAGVPDELVYRTMAIGEDEIKNQISELAESGVRNFAIVDLLAPRTAKRDLKRLSRIISDYR
jgi:phthiodiolone/phenolphthiodiolone dimycocerosates ketoreductase